MQHTVTVIDETTAGERSEKLVLEFFTQQITVEELIEQRVKQEVEQFNRQTKGTSFLGLVQPSAAERRLNRSHRRMIDWKKQANVAIHAFRGNGFLLLVNDRQLTELDEVIDIRPDTEVTFLKLIPLVGG
ncbi:MAG: hypothetical protein AAF633_18900 [Chloroflexota bacterium]